MYEHIAEAHVQNNRDCFHGQYWVSSSTLRQHYAEHHPDIAIPEQLNSEQGVVKQRDDPDSIFLYGTVDAADVIEVEERLVTNTNNKCKRVREQLERAQNIDKNITKAVEEKTKELEQLQSRKRKCSMMLRAVSVAADKWITFQNMLVQDLCPCGGSETMQACGGIETMKDLQSVP